MKLQAQVLICFLLAPASHAVAAGGRLIPEGTESASARPGTPVADARTLIANGRRAEAMILLSAHLQSHADDGDARKLYDLALSLLLVPSAREPAVTTHGAVAAVDAGPDGAGDVIAEARALNGSGRRADALLLLNIHLQAHTTDVDARMLYGLILSWDGRYDEAREALSAVLARSPGYSDARTALVNVELWSDHPERAEALTRPIAGADTVGTEVLLSRARALSALDRPADARAVVGQALSQEPGNETALRLQRSLDDRLRQWKFATTYASDWFSDGRTPWRESSTSISRQAPRVGSVIVRASHAERFSSSDNQVEIETYPKVRPGTYAFVGMGLAPAAELYPSYHLMADIYQSLGHGFEASAGIRRLSFGDGVNIYVGTVSKYKGAWLLTAKSFYVPSETGGSQSYHATVRRYFADDESYLGAHYGHGFWREELRNLQDFESLHSDGFSAEAYFVLGRRWLLSVSGSSSWEGRAGRDTLGQYSLSTGLGLRF